MSSLSGGNVSQGLLVDANALLAQQMGEYGPNSPVKSAPDDGNVPIRLAHIGRYILEHYLVVDFHFACIHMAV